MSPKDKIPQVRVGLTAREMYVKKDSFHIIPRHIFDKWFETKFNRKGGAPHHQFKGNIGNIDHVYAFVRDIYQAKKRGL